MKHGSRDQSDKFLIVPALIAATVLVVAIVALSGCAAYQFGPRSLYPAHVRTVHVPVFESDSFRRNLGERLTEAVVKHIELKTPYKVVSRDRADSVLSGRILVDTKRVVVESGFDDAREIEVGMRVQVTWIDSRGGVILDDRSIPLPANLVDVTADSTFFPEVGQSLATAQQRVIVDLAEQIVSLMEMPW